MYDTAGRLTEVDHKKSAVNLAKFVYILNSVNNRTDRTETIPGATAWRDRFTYTADDQLDTVKYNWVSASNTQDRLVDYTFDAVGNRQTLTDSTAPTTTYSAANDVNQYGTATSTSGVDTFTYDVRGNLTSVVNSASGSVPFNMAYDLNNRLLGTWVGPSANTWQMSYRRLYDARNRVVAVVTPLVFIWQTGTFYTHRKHVWDDWNLIEETSPEGAVTTYIHGAGVDEILVTTAANGTPRYHHHDGLGSVVALTDATGAPVERYRYDVFGKPSFYTGANALIPGATQSPIGNRFLYTGREQLTDLGADSLGLMDYRNRVYATGIGRFLQTDPIRFDADDMNLYRYVENRVNSFNDPFGLVINPIIPGTRPGPGGEWIYDKSCNPFAGPPPPLGVICRTACWAAGGACAGLCTGSGPGFFLCLAACGAAANLCSEACPP